MQRREFQPIEPLTVTLEAREWNIVFAGLGELPMKVSGALSGKLQQELDKNAGGKPIGNNGYARPGGPLPSEEIEGVSDT
jgi:hypothetical protein